MSKSLNILKITTDDRQKHEETMPFPANLENYNTNFGTITQPIASDQFQKTANLNIP